MAGEWLQAWWPYVVAAVVHLAFSAALVVLHARGAVSRTLALLLGAIGCLSLGTGLLAHPDATVGAWGIRIGFAGGILLAGASVALTLQFPRRRAVGPAWRRGGMAALALAALVPLAYPQAFLEFDATPTGVRVTGVPPGYLVDAVFVLAIAGTAAWLAWQHGRLPSGPLRAANLLLLAGLVFDLSFVLSRSAMLAVEFWEQSAALGPYYQIAGAGRVAGWALTVVALGLLGWRGMQEREERRALWVAVACLAPMAAAAWLVHGTATSVLAGVDAQLRSIITFAVRLPLPILLVFGALRWQLFDIDLRVRTGLRRIVLPAAAATTLFLLVQGLQVYVAAHLGIAAGLAVASSIAFLVLGLALWAATRAPASLWRPAQPWEVHRRRVEVFRAALQQSGALDAQARIRLAALRDALELSPHEATIIEHWVATSGRAVEPTIGTVLHGRYRIDGFLAAGAHGRTYLAMRDDGVRVVVKRPTGSGSLAQEAALLREAFHPNVIALLDARVEGQDPALVFEHAEGGSLKQVLAAGALPPSDFVGLVEQLLHALSHVHGVGIVHADIKPSNVLRAGTTWKLGDFGVASRLDGTHTLPLGPAPGTLRYMSPEQARGLPATPLSDLYSAALVFLEARTGSAARTSRPQESAAELQVRIAAAAEGHVQVAPPSLEAWLARALSPEPSHRFASADDMLKAFPASDARGQAAGTTVAIAPAQSRPLPGGGGARPSRAVAS